MPLSLVAFVVGNGVCHKLLCSMCVADLVEFVWLVVDFSCGNRFVGVLGLTRFWWIMEFLPNTPTNAIP